MTSSDCEKLHLKDCLDLLLRDSFILVSLYYFSFSRFEGNCDIELSNLSRLSSFFCSLPTRDYRYYILPASYILSEIRFSTSF